MIVGVIGSGSIGPDLAYGFVSALANAGGKVYLHDIVKEALDAGVARIEGYVGKTVEKGRMSPKAAEAIRGALVPTLDIKDLANCDYVMEAATENLATKRVILRNLEKVVRPDCLIGFATSGIPRAQIASEALRPERCFVNHPFFPAWRTLPIEVVLSENAQYGEQMIRTLEQLGKVPIVTADVPCFAADDVFCNYICEAVRIVEEGIATPAQVDKIVNDAIGGGGPFLVMDLTKGNLLVAHCQELMRDDPTTGSSWFAPPALLVKQANERWRRPKAEGEVSYDSALRDRVLDRILAVLLGRSYAVVENDVCEASDFDWLIRMSLGFNDGMLELGKKVGAERIAQICAAYAKEHPGFPVPKCVTQKRLPDYLRDVTIKRDGDIAVVTVRRPEAKNALALQTVQELKTAFKELDADPNIKGVVFTGFGGALAGADINELAAAKTDKECENICFAAYPVQEFMAGMKKPVVAAVDGPVMGGGAEFSMACHARVVGKNLILAQPETNLGAIPGYGGTQRLPRLIGVERALQILRAGRQVKAAEACEWGWAYGQPAEDRIAAAKELLRKHIAGEVKLATVDPAPVSLPDPLPSVDIGHRSRAIDAILMDAVQALKLPLSEGLRVEGVCFGRCRNTMDYEIGFKNFMEKGPRVPAVFEHK
jgi:enoyl-CoA hydratase / 3-hydroxyacyl-CoA dehydrogenase